MPEKSKRKLPRKMYFSPSLAEKLDLVVTDWLKMYCQWRSKNAWVTAQAWMPPKPPVTPSVSIRIHAC